MRSLPTLIKLANQRLNNQRLRLTEFEKKDAEISQTIKTLKTNLLFEANKARENPMLNINYGTYAQQINTEITNLTFTLDENKKRLVREQDRLATLFKEQKVLEIYKKQIEEKKLKEKENKIQHHMDEIAARLTEKKLKTGY